MPPSALSPQAVSDYYDRWTERYEAAFGDTFQSNRTADLDVLFEHIAGQAELAPGQRVLDAGCGVGGPALWLVRRHGVAVDGVTISVLQAEKARRKAKATGLGDRARFFSGDFHDLAALNGELAPAEGYDAVLFLESLVHSHRPEIALGEAARMLRPGGVLYVKDLFRRREPLHGEEERRVERAVRNTNRHFRLEVQSTGRIERGLRQAGLELESFGELPIATQHDLGNAFCQEHAIDIYEGEPVTYLDWLELKARKPR
ncbi:MAG: class I SAM-dependent methyltransferase [Acidobacteriota bacterium]